jgi:hypothetical protein
LLSIEKTSRGGGVCFAIRISGCLALQCSDVDCFRGPGPHPTEYRAPASRRHKDEIFEPPVDRRRGDAGGTKTAEATTQSSCADDWTLCEPDGAGLPAVVR